MASGTATCSPGISSGCSAQIDRGRLFAKAGRYEGSWVFQQDGARIHTTEASLRAAGRALEVSCSHGTPTAQILIRLRMSGLSWLGGSASSLSPATLMLL